MTCLPLVSTLEFVLFCSDLVKLYNSYYQIKEKKNVKTIHIQIDKLSILKLNGNECLELEKNTSAKITILECYKSSED